MDSWRYLRGYLGIYFQAQRDIDAIRNSDIAPRNDNSTLLKDFDRYTPGVLTPDRYSSHTEQTKVAEFTFAQIIV